MKRLSGTEAGIRSASYATPEPGLGIAHEDMAELLGLTLEEWLAPAEDTDDHDDDDCIDWEH